MNPNPVNRDDVIEEIHQTRARIAEKFGGDIAAIVEDARQRQAASGRPLWQRKSPKPSRLPSDDHSQSNRP
jgi:hypothetical protein